MSSPQTKALMLWLERRTDKRLLMSSRTRILKTDSYIKRTKIFYMKENLLVFYVHNMKRKYRNIQKILALIILIFLYSSIPILIFLFFLEVYYEFLFIIRYTIFREFMDGFIAILIMVAITGTILILKCLIKWLR